MGSGILPAPPVAPTAAFTISPDHGAVWTEFFLDASDSRDSDGSFIALQFRWDWNNDGVWDSGSGQGWLDDHTLTHVFTEPGVYAVLMETMDEDGLIASTLHSVDVSGGPLAFFSMDENIVNVGEPIVFDASTSESDPGESIVSYEWDWEFDGGFEAGGITTEHSYADYGNYAVVLRVTDSVGDSAMDTLFLAVLDLEDFVMPSLVNSSNPDFEDSLVFYMGSPADMLGTELDETPVHKVKLTHDIAIGETEVTNYEYMVLAQWALAQDPPLIFCNGLSVVNDYEEAAAVEFLDLDDPHCEIAFNDGVFHLRDAGFGLNPDHPVKEVTWYGAAAYCNWLTAAHPTQTMDLVYNFVTWGYNLVSPYSGSAYRLPTEAEWEFACRADSDTLSAFANDVITDIGCNDPALDVIGWYCGNSSGWTEAVGQMSPNSFAIFDMHGNLWEWCTDWSLGSYYSQSPGGDPWGPDTGSNKIIRGGFFGSNAADCRSASRFNASPEYSGESIGFRVARSKPNG